MFRFNKSLGVVGAVFAALTATSGSAQNANDDGWRTNYTLYGTSGLIDLPSAVVPADGEISATVAGFGESQRSTFTFQILPRVTGSFRYSRIDTFDRSFDLQYLFAQEGRLRPAISIGLRDFIGTGRFSSEFIVATKTLSPHVRVTGGLGWGRLGGIGGFSNPLGALDGRLDTRPDDGEATGGTVLASQFFRGDAAFFGGVEWRLNDEWTLLAEYSSDAYEREIATTGFDRASPLNFGVTWKPSDGYQLGAYYIHGSEIGLSATLIIDPKNRPNGAGFDQAPIPVSVRPADRAAAATWDTPQVQTNAVELLGAAMATDGFRLLGAQITGNTMRVRYENTTYRAEAQGVGRLARMLTAATPANIDTFILEPTQRGIPLSAVTIQRGDLEALENVPNAAAFSYDRVVFNDAAGPAPNIEFNDPTPAFEWGVTPYVALSLFDANEPVRGGAGLAASFQYEIRPNIVIAGTYVQEFFGSSDDDVATSESPLPDVRSSNLRFGGQSNGGLENLYISWYGHPGSNIYTRASAGYFERGFAGVSSEVLWKPVDSRLALGAEVNYTVLRDFDRGLGFRPVCSDVDCTVFEGDDYDVVTGHVSAYYAFDNGFVGQIDAGRFLAGDWGATFGLDREFTNGWKVGAYFTLTDVSFEDFGEGSFDKGIRIEIPLDAILGTPTRDTTGLTLTSLTRDGGARLQIDGRLYEVVEDGHQGQMADSWGRFWR